MSVKCSACNSYTVFTIVKDQKRNDFIHYVLFHYLADWSFFRILAKYWNSPKKSPILFLVSFHRTIIWSLFLNCIYVKWVPDNLSKKNKKKERHSRWCTFNYLLKETLELRTNEIATKEHTWRRSWHWTSGGQIHVLKFKRRRTGHVPDATPHRGAHTTLQVQQLWLCLSQSTIHFIKPFLDCVFTTKHYFSILKTF